LKGHSLRIGDTVKEIQGTIDPQEERGTLRIDGASLEVSFKPLYPGCYRIVLEGRPYTVWVDRQGKAKHICVRGSAFIVEDAARSGASFARRRSIEEGPGEVTPPMPSVVVRVLVNEGDRVEKGQGLLVVTAMKMETTLKAPYAGIVKKINTQPEAKVMPGDILVEIEPEVESHE